MDEKEQAHERRIGALRQAVSWLRGKRDKASEGAAAGWADELERLADEEAVEANKSDRRLAYRNVVAYMRSELGLDRNQIKAMMTDVVNGMITKKIEAMIGEQVAGLLTYYSKEPTNKLQNMVDARVQSMVNEAVHAEVGRIARESAAGLAATLVSAARPTPPRTDAVVLTRADAQALSIAVAGAASVLGRPILADDGAASVARDTLLAATRKVGL